MFSCEYCEIFKNKIFTEQNFKRCFWQSYHSTVKSAGVPVHWFCTSTWFWCWSKTSTIFSLLELINHVLPILEYVLEKHLLHYTNNYATSHVKDFLCFHFSVDQVLSISGYDLENGRMLCKQKYKIKNMAVKIFILFCFCLLWWLSPVSTVGASCLNCICPCRWF